MISDGDRRGAQVFALDLAVGLQALGVDVATVALTPGSHGDPLPVGTLGRRLGLTTLRQLRSVARQYDVVVAHGSSTLPASALALVGSKVPIVYRQISDPTVWASTWSRRVRVAAFLRRMDAVIALSGTMSTILKRHYWIRSRPAVSVIPNAVPDERFRPPTLEMRTEARSVFGIPLEAGVILTIGALAPEKAVDRAVLACADVPGAFLLVVGEGSQRRELEELARRHLPGRCLFAGVIDRPHMTYWAADVLLLPSRSEAMPAVLIEAGLSGLAAVATDVGAVREVIDHGETGYVVPVDDSEAMAAALAGLLKDDATRAAMGAAAAERCHERFTIARTASAWLGVLSGLEPDRT